MSYFRPRNARKTALRSVCRLPNSTQKVSRKRGRAKLESFAPGLPCSKVGALEQYCPEVRTVPRSVCMPHSICKCY